MRRQASRRRRISKCVFLFKTLFRCGWHSNILTYNIMLYAYRYRPGYARDVLYFTIIYGGQYRSCRAAEAHVYMRHICIEYYIGTFNVRIWELCVYILYIYIKSTNYNFVRAHTTDNIYRYRCIYTDVRL